MLPTFILQSWLLGFVSLGVIAGFIYLANEWQKSSWVWDVALQKSVFVPHLGANRETAILAAAFVLLVIALFGTEVIKLVCRLVLSPNERENFSPHDSPPMASKHRLRRPDGTKLEVEFYGPKEAPLLVLTHGWGLNGNEWNYLKRELSDRFRLVVWDLPGLGRSVAPASRDFSIEKLARDLDAVLGLSGDKPALLVGHSIGGMITLTFCRLFASALGSRVAGLVLTHTTPDDPVHTTSGGALYTAIEKPVLMPLMYLTIFFSPLLRLTNWLAYRNGSAHLSVMRGSFAGTETWEQVDFAARFNLQAPPAILAHGMLGMMKYTAKDVLASIPVPTLIVAGNKDTSTKIEASEWMKAKIPQTKYVVLKPAKHLGLIEHHAQYADYVREIAFATFAQFESRLPGEPFTAIVP